MSEALARTLADARVRGIKLGDYPGPAPTSEDAAFDAAVPRGPSDRLASDRLEDRLHQRDGAEDAQHHSPFPGPVYAERTIEDGGTVNFSDKALRLVEPEIAFKMARDLPVRDSAWTPEEALAAAASAHLSLELVNRRLPGGLEDGNMWNIADGGCNDAFVLGPANEVLPAGSYAGLELSVMRNDDVASTGKGVNALGGPDIALAWLANYLNAQGLHAEGRRRGDDRCRDRFDLRGAGRRDYLDVRRTGRSQRAIRQRLIRFSSPCLRRGSCPDAG
jgi:2-keto-4-pentenoate hydratase